jgi:hypothetical protein
MTCTSVMVKTKWTFCSATAPRMRRLLRFLIRPLRLVYRRSFVLVRLQSRTPRRLAS